MEKDYEKIVIYRETDPELYRLVDKISITPFGVIKFEERPVKEIRMKENKPYLIVTIEKTDLLKE